MRLAGFSTVVLMVVGAVGTWASASAFGISVSVNGGDRDGVIVIVCAVIIAVGLFVANRAVGVLAVVAAIASTATAIYDVNDIQGTAHISVGWGLWLALVASIVAVLDTVMFLVISGRTADA